MTFRSDIDAAVSSITDGWDVSTLQTNSTDVPDEAKLIGRKASKVSATYLYTDIINSSGLVKVAPAETVASIMAAFLKVSVRAIRFHDGHIRSFDGDRVMGIFTGPRKASRAVSAALNINWAVGQLLDPAIRKQFKSIRSSTWTLEQMTGIATGEALMVKVGIRNNSDLLSAGLAPNLAAKLSDLRPGGKKHIAISKGTFDAIADSEKISNGKPMWAGPGLIEIGGANYSYYTSTWRRAVL